MERPINQPVAVVDTMALLATACRADVASTHLAGIANVGAPMFVAREVLGEVDRLMPKFADDRGVDRATAMATWEQRLRPRLRVVDLAVRDHLHPEVARVRTVDVDDTATAALALLVSPAVVLSDDRSLVEAGLAVRPWTTAAGDHRTVETIDAAVAAAVVFGDVALRGAWSGTSGLVRLARRYPLGAALFVMAVVIAMRPRAETVAARAHDGLRGAGAALGRQAMARQNAVGRLVVVEDRCLPGLEQRCARVLARSSVPLTSRDLADRLPGLAGSLPTRAVGSVLAGHAAFVEVASGLWQLGKAPDEAPRTPAK